MPREVYESSVISRRQFFAFSAGVVLLSMILGGCIYYAGKSVSDDDDDPNEDEVLQQVSLPHPKLQRIPPTPHTSEYVTIAVTNGARSIRSIDLLT
jgi:hypothetical protein